SASRRPTPRRDQQYPLCAPALPARQSSPPIIGVTEEAGRQLSDRRFPRRAGPAETRAGLRIRTDAGAVSPARFVGNAAAFLRQHIADCVNSSSLALEVDSD